MDLVDIRKNILAAISSDDDLYDILVLKGGNALNLIYGIGNRSSLDIDYSIEGDFDDIDLIGDKLKSALEKRLLIKDLIVFDFSFMPKPPNPSDPIWGGYRAEFKLVSKSIWEESDGNIDLLRRQSLSIDGDGSGKRAFKIEISRKEYCAGKTKVEIDDFPIYVYTLPMIVAEKLRAICQQMDDYPLQKTPSPRPRDFYDIHAVITVEKIDVTSADFLQLVKDVFETKKVDLRLLENVSTTKDFHEVDWPSVESTMGGEIEDFGYYFSFTLEQISKLQSLWVEN